MAYCVAADVQQDFKSITFSSTSLVTLAAVTQFIVEADALINSFVGQRWTVPITADASSLALMQLFSRTLVADRIRKILEVKQTTSADTNENVRGQGFTTADVMKALNDIRMGNMQLTGATLLVPDAGFYSNNSASNQQPRFKKKVRQW